MRTFYIIFVLLLSWNTQELLSQNGTGIENSAGLSVGNLRNGEGLRPINNRKIDIKGSTLLFDDFIPGYIVFKEGRPSSILNLNFDLITKTVHVSGTKEKLGIELLYVDSICIRYDGIFDDNYRKYINYNTGSDNSLLEILVDGDYTLLKSINAKLLEPSYNVALDSGSRDYTVRKKIFYYILKDDKLIEIELGNKKISNNKKLNAKIRKSAKSTKLKLKKETALISFFESINSEN